ncbi:MAG: sodium:solute symporter family protein [Pirellulaceae bacterium]
MTPLLAAALIDGWGAAIVAAYLVALLVIGWLGKRASASRSMADFFLAGRGLGTFVLLLTLFATQYSGNTLVGMSGKTYRVGYQFLVAVPLFVALVGVAMVEAPGLQRLGRRRGYITLADAVHDRLRSRTLTILVALVCVWALVNFLVSNLVAVGYLVERATEGVVSSSTAIVALALVMLAYETLGGLRAVVWTDVLQGVLIGAGTLILAVTVIVHYGGPEHLDSELSTTAPQLLAAPDFVGCVSWSSTLVLIGVGAAIYPHAVQRYYAARSGETLRRSLRWMLVMPFFVAGFAVLMGLTGRVEFPDLENKESEQVTMLLLADLTREAAWLRPIVVLFLTAVLAAIMSTVDSVLLALSATVTQDFYRPLRGPKVSEAHLTRVGKLTSWALMGGAVLLALTLSKSVWRITEIKLEVMIQAAPAVFLALYGRDIRPWPLASGLVVGVVIAVAPIASEVLAGLGVVETTLPEKLLGLHLGVLGLAANVLTTALLWRVPWKDTHDPVA